MTPPELAKAADVLHRVTLFTPSMTKAELCRAKSFSHVGDAPIAYWHLMAAIHAMIIVGISYHIIAVTLHRSLPEVSYIATQARELFPTCTFFRVAATFYADPSIQSKIAAQTTP